MDLILTLTGALSAALALGLLAKRLRLSPIVGYLAAGVIVGPFTSGYIAHPDLANQMADLGVVLLMFGVGLNFHLKDLLAVRKVAVPGALVGVATATGLGALLARAFHPSLGSSVVFGLSIGVASTVVLLRVLGDHAALHTRAGHLAVGWLVVEDVLTVVALVELPALAGGAMAWGRVATVLGVSLLKVAGLGAIALGAGQRLIPRALAYVAKTRSRELFTLTVLVVALGIAVASLQLFGTSMALGAFLAGVVVGQSEFSTRAASEALPMRDAFAVLFFVSIGMLFQPATFASNVGLALGALAVILVAKPLAVFCVLRVHRYPAAVAAMVAGGCAQIGEFSFVLGGLGRRVHLLDDAAIQAIVVASIVAITLAPFVFRGAAALGRRLDAGRPPAEARGEAALSAAAHGAVIVGYGPVGRTVARLLRENGVPQTIVDLNHEVVGELKAGGFAAVYGDASQIEVLRRAGAEHAATLVFAASGTLAEAVVRAAKELNPAIHILARCGYAREVRATKEAGAGIVVAAELEVALAMAEHVLTDLGATGEQLDRERERVRRRLLDETGA